MKPKTPVFLKPSVVLPIAMIVAVAVALLVLGNVGNAPVVGDIQTTASSTHTSTNSNTSSLAFNTSGRVATVNVKVGDKVSHGEVLGTLDSAQAQGAVNQAEGALELAQAQYGSMSVQYKNAQVQQNILVNNAYHTLLSSGLEATPFGIADETHNPIITGTYTCDTKGTYEIDPYTSGTDSGYSFNVHGLEEGSGNVTFGNPQPLGSCGLSITFVKGFSGSAKWTVSIPNTKSANYQVNENAYNLAVATRDQVLSQLSANLGQNGSTGADVANASITAAQGALDAAEAALANYTIVAPTAGTVSFIDDDLKVGQSVTSGHSVITITTQ